MQKILEKLITDSGLSRKMQVRTVVHVCYFLNKALIYVVFQEIIGSYIIMEEFYMRETVNKVWLSKIPFE